MRQRVVNPRRAHEVGSQDAHRADLRPFEQSDPPAAMHRDEIEVSVMVGDRKADQVVDPEGLEYRSVHFGGAQVLERHDLGTLNDLAGRQVACSLVPRIGSPELALPLAQELGVELVGDRRERPPTHRRREPEEAPLRVESTHEQRQRDAPATRLERGFVDRIYEREDGVRVEDHPRPPTGHSAADGGRGPLRASTAGPATAFCAVTGADAVESTMAASRGTMPNGPYRE